MLEGLKGQGAQWGVAHSVKDAAKPEIKNAAETAGSVSTDRSRGTAVDWVRRTAESNIGRAMQLFAAPDLGSAQPGESNSRSEYRTAFAAYFPGDDASDRAS